LTNSFAAITYPKCRQGRRASDGTLQFVEVNLAGDRGVAEDSLGEAALALLGLEERTEPCRNNEIGADILLVGRLYFRRLGRRPLFRAIAQALDEGLVPLSIKEDVPLHSSRFIAEHDGGALVRVEEMADDKRCGVK
jgi:hypothetical protein